MMTCPYNIQHVFKKEKFLKHLEHCNAKKNSNRKLYKCKFDSFIRFFKEDREEHYAKCPCGKKQNYFTHEKEALKEEEDSKDIIKIIEKNNCGLEEEKSFHNATIISPELQSLNEHIESNQSSINFNNNTKLY